MLNEAYKKGLDLERRRLQERGMTFEEGLSSREMHDLESRLSIVFPDDLKWFLQTSLPVGPRFPSWRGSEEALRELIDWPLEGICFDIRNKVFWWNEWGERPKSDDQAVVWANEHLVSVPRLVPVFGHSYLPSDSRARLPVFSIHQADVIHRGGDLLAYLRWLLHDEGDDSIEEQYPVFDESYEWIPFWSALAKHNAT